MNTSESQSALHHESLRSSAKKFAEITVKIAEGMLAAKYSIGNIEIIDQGMSVDRKFFVSMFFTGMVYGEYVLAMDEEVAAKLLGKGEITQVNINQIRVEISETFCEFLNIVVGESILALGDQYKKLTITAPRVFFGKIDYPRVKTARATLVSDKGAIECYLYIDRMKLDIAASYKDALGSLLKAHKELLAAMSKLKEQQSLLVQSEKMAALGTMAAGVAHEINTPLAAVSIIGGTLKDLLREEIVDKKLFAENLDLIEQTVSNISRITNGLRTYARGIGGEAFSSNSVQLLVANALALCGVSLKEKGIALQLGPLSEDTKIECRPLQITQILVNVIGNAADAIVNMTEKWIKIDVVDGDGFVEIRVTDSGAGIAPEMRDRIFDPFFTTKGIGGGTGLGLSVSKGIMDDHHGSIVVDPNSKNTRFISRLPKLRRKAA